MLTWIKGWFTNSGSSANRLPPASETEVISLRIKLPSSSAPPPLKPAESPPAVQSTQATRRRRPRSKRHLKLGGLKFATRHQLTILRRAGLVNAGDLARCDPQRLVAENLLPKTALGWLKKQRRASRLFIQLRPLQYFDAILLLAIHRKSIPLLAGENPVRLYRDIQRFSLSTAGVRLLGHRAPPSQRQVERWVDAAKRRHPGKYGYELNIES